MAWPTTDDPRTEFVTLRLTASEAADLDWYVTQRGAKDRSKAMREALDRVIHAEKKRAARAKKTGGSKPGGRVDERDD